MSRAVCACGATHGMVSSKKDFIVQRAPLQSEHHGLLQRTQSEHHGLRWCAQFWRFEQDEAKRIKTQYTRMNPRRVVFHLLGKTEG